VVMADPSPCSLSALVAMAMIESTPARPGRASIAEFVAADPAATAAPDGRARSPAAAPTGRRRTPAHTPRPRSRRTRDPLGQLRRAARRPAAGTATAGCPTSSTCRCSPTRKSSRRTREDTRGATLTSSAADPIPTAGTSDKSLPGPAEPQPKPRPPTTS
jgi:hypothetical protein